jgi:DNA-binding transcriptional LysR family regulator
VDKAEDGLANVRHSWAVLVRELGISAVARELDLTAQAVAARVKYIEDRSRR